MKRMTSMTALFLVSLVSMSLAGSDAEFDGMWHDGRAELDGYKLKVSRYGEERVGTAVMIYVTEPFSRSRRVKVDDPTRKPDDTVDVLKLNLVRDFQTGIYDYNTMTSVFAASGDFMPLKISFSSAEWCGHVYEEWRVEENLIEGVLRSYFEGESGEINLRRPAAAVEEDNLFILLRGLRGDYLRPGEKKTIQLLPSMYHARLSHNPPHWVESEIARESKTKKVRVPAGRFEAIVYTLSTTDGRQGIFYVEKNYPHRIVKWSLSPDVSGELTGTERLPYWQLQGNGDEKYLKKLGLGR